MKNDAKLESMHRPEEEEEEERRTGYEKSKWRKGKIRGRLNLDCSGPLTKLKLPSPQSVSSLSPLPSPLSPHASHHTTV